MSTEALILRTALGEGREVPAALQGLPTEIDGQPVRYRRKALLKAGRYIHPKHGVYEFTRADLETCARHTREWIADGYKPYLPPGHKPYSKALNYGWILDPSVEGDTLYGTAQLIGEDAHREAARNDVSVFIRKDAVAPNGKKHAFLLEHVSLCPDPVAGNLGGFIPMSRDGAAPEEVPVYQMSTAAPAARNDVMKLTAEQKQRFQKLAPEGLTIGDELGDADVWKVIDHIDGKAKQADTDKTAALSRATTAETERDDFKTQVAAFSRTAPRTLSTEAQAERDEILRDRAGLTASGIDIAVAKGDVPAVIGGKLKELIKKGDKPNAFMLSRSDDLGDRPADFMLKLFEGTELGRKAGDPEAGVVAFSRDSDPDKDKDKPVTKDRRNELRAMAGLAPVA